MLVSEAIDTLLPRIRDPNAGAFGTAPETRDVLRGLLSLSQRCINSAALLVLDRAPITIPPFVQLIQHAVFLPVASDILRVYENGRELRQCAWEEFARVDRGWFGREADKFQTFAQIGVDCFALDRVQRQSVSIEVVYVKVLDDLLSETQAFELPQEGLKSTLDLTEALIALRRRRLGACVGILSRVQAGLTELGVDREMPPMELPRAAV